MTRTASPGDRLYKVLTTPSYTLVEASQLTGVSRWRAARWLTGYQFAYKVGNVKRESRKDPVIVHSDEPSASFLDLIDLLFVKRFIERGFTLQFLRNALEEARELLGSPHFARNKFFTSGRHLILELESESKYMIELMTGGQSAISQIVEQLDDKIDFEDVTGFGFATRWYPKGRRGLVVIDPQIAFGRPTIMGRGVATESIYDLYLGENKKIERVSHWYNIPAPEIRAAVNFQSGLAGA
ncbi:MAG: DUF433 domain-containing protein [Anaerolineales bacterium]|nr:MAG: DUF433 domain-containing protein [Chloroflexota bacterium]MCK6540680.1 DUF433 domain-containing protein [Anaerolineales bacterium]